MNRNNFLRILLIFMACVFATRAHARYMYPKSFYVTGMTTQLTDVGSASSSAVAQAFPKQVTQAEVGVRLFSIFCLNFVGQKGSNDANDSLQGYGLGMRVDLPGFFLLGADESDMRRRAKAYPVNSSIFMQSIETQFTQGTSVTKTIANRYGITVEIFPFQTLMYLSLEAGIYNFSGNSYANTGAGLGMQF